MQIYDYFDRMLRLIQIFREKFRDVFEGKNKIYRNFFGEFPMDHFHLGLP